MIMRGQGKQFKRGGLQGVLSSEGKDPLMTGMSGTPDSRRCLVPRALKDVFTGVIPSGLKYDLKLPSGTCFETLVPSCVDVGDYKEDRRLLDHLTALAGSAITSWRLDLTARAFPAGVASSINFARLPLHTRTRNCLEKKGLLTADLLQRQSLEDLLEIPAFGVKCLVDLLTAVEGANLATEGDATSAEPAAAVPEQKSAPLLLRLTGDAPVLKSWNPDDSYARRCLIPQALEELFKGTVPSRLARDLELPRGTRFETLVQALVEVRDHTEDRRFLNHLTALVRSGLTSPRLDLTRRAFPVGVVSSINFARLLLHARTRNSLEKAGLLSVDVLQRQSLGELLAIPGFGPKCLLDLLTAVEAVNQAVQGDALSAEPIAVVREPEAATLSPKLTREARLLGNEPWAKDVSLYDIRLGTRLLKDEESLKDVRKALNTGRIPLEQRLCPEPARNLNLLCCPLLTYTRNRLCEAGLTTVSAVASLTLREARLLPGLSERALADLLTVLDVCRFPASAVTDGNHEPTLADFCEAVVNRTSDAWFPERLAERIHQTRVLGIRCLSLSLEEELRDLTASVFPTQPEAAIEYLGWDGRGPRTLAAVGNARALTKERVRQLVAGLTDRMSAASVWTPVLRQVLEVCSSVSPRPAEQVAALLREKGLATVAFHPHGVLTAAEGFKVTHSFCLRRFGETDWLFQGDQEALLRRCFELARSAIAARGACSLGDLQAELGEQMHQDLAEDSLREWIGWLPNACWLDEDRQWFRFDSGSSMETMLWKILSVAPEIQLGELREGLMRHHRSPSALPSVILRQLCRHLGFQVQGDIVRAEQQIRPEDDTGKIEDGQWSRLINHIRTIRPEDFLSEVELTFFNVLRAEGPLLPTNELEKRCLQRGMNRHTFWVYLTYSPILAQYASGVFGLRGAQVAPGEAEGLRPRMMRTRVVQDFGWKRSGVAWIAYTVTDGILRSGVVGMPAGMRDALGDGSWPLFTVDRARIGTLICRDLSIRGLGPFFHRRGADVGDVLVLEIDRKTAVATVRVGGSELIEQARCDRHDSSDFVC